MKLSPRFALDNLFVVGGAFLVVSAFAFSAPVAGWLAFGVSTGFAVLAGVSVALTRRTGIKIGHGLLGLVALWSLIAALVFSGNVLMWLVFADAIALAAVAFGDLTAHEVGTENVVHRLEVSTPVQSETPAGRIAA
ncbi:MAG TPA: hypothetical protein VG253_15335 [Streptosporangiaceae bacterium]|jgi:hypothetical protein|nr:hypothetical protein [Streptosporangiaceae bacterium]